MLKIPDGVDKTEYIQAWLRGLDDKAKLSFAINWRIPHSVFNMCCKYYDVNDLQHIDFYKIYKEGLGTWSHGGKVITIGRR